MRAPRQAGDARRAPQQCVSVHSSRGNAQPRESVRSFGKSPLRARSAASSAPIYIERLIGCGARKYCPMPI
jgi:hypothetical protein